MINWGKERRGVFGFSWVGWLNLLVLQFFFIRLAITTRHTQEPGQHPETTFSFCFLKGVIPFTGWADNNFRFLKSKK